MKDKIKIYEKEMDQLSVKLYLLQQEEKKLKDQLTSNSKQQENLMTQIHETFNTWRKLIENKRLEGD